MNANELVSLCSAHGIDFIRVAGSASKLDGTAAPRRRKIVEIEAGITEVRETASGKESRVSRAPAWSQAELGIAAGGRTSENGNFLVSALAWSAIQHTIANDRTPLTLHILHRGLMNHAQKFATQQDWEVMLPGRGERDPKTGKRISRSKRGFVFYREALCMLVLDEISFKPAFTAAPQLYALYLGIEPDTWEKTVAERFTMLQMRYQCWHGAGLRIIQQRINGPAEYVRDEMVVA